MLVGKCSRRPAKGDIPGHVCRTISRTGAKRYHAGATGAFGWAGLRPRERVIGIGGQNDLVNNKSVLTHPDIQDMDAERRYIDLRPFRPLISTVVPFVIVVPAAQIVRKGSCHAVQTGVAGVIAATGTPGQDPHIVRAGLDKVNLIVQPRTRVGIAGVVKGGTQGLHTGRAGKAFRWPDLYPFNAT